MTKEATARPQRRSIAVLGFRNLSGRKDTAWLSPALAEMFTVELGVGDRLHTVTGESVTRTKRDLGLGDTENLSAETLARLRRLLGCDAILLGSYFALGTDGGDQIRVDLRLQDTESGEMLSVLTATKTEKELFELVAALGRDLRQKLGSGPVSRTETAATRASFPVGQEATRLYSEGLQHLRSLDTLAARDLLLEATRAEPAFPLAHAALASAWATLGYDKNAQDEAAQALALSSTLAREDRLLVEALHAETRNNWPKAVEIYDSLCRFFPDDPEYGLRLAHTEVAAGRAQEALRTVESLRRLPAPAADDPRIDLAESEAAAALSDYARQEKTAARAVEKGRSLGARLLTAQALHLQGRALRSLGRQEQALARIEEAERIFQEANDQVGVGGALHDLGNLLRDRGDFEGARERYERALDIHRAAGNQGGIVLALTNLGGLELQRGNYVRAQSLLSDVVATAREVHDPVGEARGLSTLGSILQEQGKLVAAQRYLEEALARFRSTGSLQGEAGVRANLSNVLLDLGKLPEARDEADKAVRLTRQIGHPRSRGYALRQMGAILIEEGKLGDAEAAFREMEALADQTGHKQLLADAKSGLALIQRFQGKLPLARENAGRALALWTESVEEQQAARGLVTMARLGLDAGELGPAERDARAAVDQFRSLHLPDGEALAHEALAAIFLARGEPGAADREVRRAQELTVSTQNRRLKLILAIAAGRTAAAQGNATDARRTLAAARDESTALGLRFSVLDATLALAEIELRQSSPSARQALQSVRNEATRQGFQLVARRVEKLLAPPATSPR